jgi:predicted nucleotidyltransferase
LASTPAIGLLGDVMLGRGVAERLRRDPPEDVWSPEVRELCRSLDAVVANLECCISERGRQTSLIPGKPFFFRGPPAAVESLRALGVTAVSLANNHALDYGPEALEDSLTLLERSGIAAAGAGLDPDTSSRGAVVEAGDLRLGVVPVTDHPREFAAAADSPGVAYADLRAGLPAWVAEELERLRRAADVVLVFPHWGPNMTVRPAQWQHRRARELVEAGAHAVAGHSAHVFHGVERVDGSPVLYDLGDGLDDYAVDEELRNDLGILAIWRPGGQPEVELVGIHLHFCFTDLARGEEADWIASRLGRACRELGTRVVRLDEQRFALFDVEDVLDRIVGWTRERPDVKALALVGSYARGAAEEGSDVDIVLLTDDPAGYLDTETWARELGAEGAVGTRRRGALTERRLTLPTGVEVEVGVALPAWARTNPVDPGTREVLQGGIRALHDPEGLLEGLRVACG